MHEQDLAIVKALVPVAWADGRFEERERELLDALLEAYGASNDEREALHAYAATRRSLEDLSAGDRRLILHHAVLVAHADGEETASETELLGRLAERLGIPTGEAAVVIESATAHAKRHRDRIL
jgi:tellurite resistance protein